MFEGVLTQPEIYTPYSKRNLKKAALYSFIWFIAIWIIAGSVYLLVNFLQTKSNASKHSLIYTKDYSALMSKNSTASNITGDLNGDGIVDDQDLQLLMNNWTDKTVVLRDSPSASVSSPIKIVNKPVVIQQ